MAESPASNSSHDSGDEGATSTQGKHSTSSKDKECPYCHQKFTSSSLGRHLDQFLNKKKPDGLHNVQEIKKLRSGITRRTARGGKKNGDGPDTDIHDKSRTVTQSPRIFTQQVSTEPAKLPSIDTRDGKFNPRVGWQATGVITDPVTIGDSTLNSTTHASPVNVPVGGSLAGTKRSFTTFSSDMSSSATSANEHARALELSLREVLDAVNVATRRAAPLPQPFPFDLTTQSFPALCLKLLSHPPTLFQPNPFPLSDTIPLQPPGLEQLQALRIRIKYILDDWKWDALAHAQKNCKQDGLSVGEEAERLNQKANQKIEESLRHLDMAFQYYAQNPPESQCRIWDLELLRAHKAEQDALKEAKEQIARITQEAAQLQQQIEHLSKCQWPREMALWPPIRNTFSSDVRRELTEGKLTSSDRFMGSEPKSLSGAQCVDEDRWDFDKLINKWKRHVREDRARRGAAGSTAMPPPSEHNDRTGTPPVGLGVAGLRKSTSDGTGQNGYHLDSRTSSPTTRNGFHMGITDKLATFAGQDQQNGTARVHAGTPSTHSNPSTSRTQTPFQGSHMGVVSDVDTIYARMEPYYRAQAEEEQREKELVGD